MIPSAREISSGHRRANPFQAAPVTRKITMKTPKRKSTLSPLTAVLSTALLLGASLAFAQAGGEPAKPGAPTTTLNSAEAKYQGAASPLANEPMHQTSNPKAPPMTQAEFDKARQIYFERCAGCHGVLRKGATGKPLTPDVTVPKGTDYLKVFIGYGSPAGMPNWLTSGDFDETNVDLMARYIQHDAPTPPEFSLADMEKTRKEYVPVAQRPTKKMNNYNINTIFSVTLRDAGTGNAKGCLRVARKANADGRA